MSGRHRRKMEGERCPCGEGDRAAPVAGGDRSYWRVQRAGAAARLYRMCGVGGTTRGPGRRTSLSDLLSVSPRGLLDLCGRTAWLECGLHSVKGEPEKGWMVLESEEEDANLLFSLAKEDKVGVHLGNKAFSLSVALEDSSFSDISIACSDGRELQAHRAVLAAAYPTVKERDWDAMFQAKPHSFGHMVLSCIYSDSLPTTLDLPQAKQLAEWLHGQPSLGRLTNQTAAFIEAHNLKQRMKRLIDDIMSLLRSAKEYVYSLNMSDTVKVRYTINQLIKDVVLGASKVSLLCQMYATKKKVMGKEYWFEVLKHLKFQVVGFLDLVQGVVGELVRKWEELSEEQQWEIAKELIPDIEQAWDVLLRNGSLIQNIWGDLPPLAETEQETPVNVVLRLLSHASESKRLQKIHKLFEFVEMAQSKREWWESCSEEDKAVQVLTMVGKLLNEVEVLQEGIEDHKRENGLEWKQICSYVDMGCMYVSWGLQRVLVLKGPLKQLLLDGLGFVGSSELKETAVSLGLLEEEDKQVEEVGGIDQIFSTASNPSCVGPQSLAQGCMQLAGSKQFADMTFVLGSEEVIQAHRVIVAAHSVWARVALLSGMREDRERRIEVSSVDEGAFRVFLKCLYGAPLPAPMDTESLCQLMILADRFQTLGLVQSCKVLLAGRIRDDSQVADIVQADHLREILGLLPGPADTNTLPSLPSPHPVGAGSSSSSRASSEDEEELQLESITPEWNQALDSLRAVVGSEISNDDLRQLLLKADMDINRALNYFFNTQ